MRAASCGAKYRSKLLRTSVSRRMRSANCAVLDRDGGDAGERDEELEVLVGEAVRRRSALSTYSTPSTRSSLPMSGAQIAERTCCMHDRLAAEARRPRRRCRTASRPSPRPPCARSTAARRAARRRRACRARSWARARRCSSSSRIATRSTSSDLVRVLDDLVEERVDVHRAREPLRDLEQQSRASAGSCRSAAR